MKSSHSKKWLSQGFFTRKLHQPNDVLQPKLKNFELSVSLCSYWSMNIKWLIFLLSQIDSCVFLVLPSFYYLSLLEEVLITWKITSECHEHEICLILRSVDSSKHEINLGMFSNFQKIEFSLKNVAYWAFFLFCCQAKLPDCKERSLFWNFLLPCLSSCQTSQPW